MDDVLGYAGKRVVITGAASGMGAATAAALSELGALVTALDCAPITAPVDLALSVDLLDGASISAAIEAIEGPVAAVFSCAGLPGAPFSDRDTMIVNVVGARAVVEGLLPKMPSGSAVVCVASSAGIGWERAVGTFRPLFEADGFDAGVDWLDANPDTWSPGGYGASKKAVNAWVAWRCAGLLKDHGIRINCINPGPTDTAMLPAFHESAGKALVDSALGPIGRYASSSEQAWPMIFLNSPRSSYVAGAGVFTDGGFYGSLMTGNLVIAALGAPAK
jgi:NAD(P)-dependent dehydrogenase (short-subunit alcohol dehydrogenase family)